MMMPDVLDWTSKRVVITVLVVVLCIFCVGEAWQVIRSSDRDVAIEHRACSGHISRAVTTSSRCLVDSHDQIGSFLKLLR